ncbi:MAG TPA: D-2-hydroxyacid dehydrogenase [Tepidisphaeraceae bacterium]|nr:D-2-hydroxyacid dehydrogenase [Tepidisphaeraceae bacterium]
MPDPLTIWSNTKLPDDLLDRLQRSIAPHRIVQPANATANNLAGAPRDPQLDRADVALGQPDPDQVMGNARLKWVQLTTAGYTRYDAPAFREAVKRNGTIVCNASSIYAEPCAQHALAMMLALARRLPQALENQRGGREWPYLPLRSESRLLNGQTVLLVGYGAIARRLAELLAPMRMNVIGFRRHPRGDEAGVRVLAVTELDDWLPRGDHVVNILPLSRQTELFFNATRLAKLKRTACYYNIGRGSTNDEYALWTALETRHFAAAYIDATMAEPLPPDDPLWSAPNCYITPHTAGGHDDEFARHVEMFIENLRRLQAGEELIDRIM